MKTQKFSYNESLAEIDSIISKIEKGEYSIDDLSEQIKRVTFLLKKCKDHLRATEKEVDNLLNDLTE